MTTCTGGAVCDLAAEEARVEAALCEVSGGIVKFATDNFEADSFKMADFEDAFEAVSLLLRALQLVLARAAGSEGSVPGSAHADRNSGASSTY